MVRHGGMALPSVRGLGWSQRFARFVATGLIVVLADHPRAPCRGARRAGPRHDLPVRPSSCRRRRASRWPCPRPGDASAAAASYTVQAGDSVYQIAQRLSGADRGRTVAVAEQILDLNLGRVMTDGQRVHERGVHRAGLDPGAAGRSHLAGRSTHWTAAEPAAVHVVERGETLWSIAGDELGAPTRWPEIWEQNRGATMADDRVFDDPDLIIPGWVLDLPVADVHRRTWMRRTCRRRRAGRRRAGRRSGRRCTADRRTDGRRLVAGRAGRDRRRASRHLRPSRHLPPCRRLCRSRATRRSTVLADADRRRPASHCPSHTHGDDRWPPPVRARARGDALRRGAHPGRRAPTATAPGRRDRGLACPCRRALHSRPSGRCARSAPTNGCSASTSPSERLPASCARENGRSWP